MEKLLREAFRLGQQWVKDINDEKEPVSFTEWFNNQTKDKQLDSSSVVRFSECKCNEDCKHLDCSVIKCKQLNKKC